VTSVQDSFAREYRLFATTLRRAFVDHGYQHGGPDALVAFVCLLDTAIVVFRELGHDEATLVEFARRSYRAGSN